LNEVAAFDPRKSQVAGRRYFGGLSAKVPRLTQLCGNRQEIGGRGGIADLGSRESGIASCFM